VSLYPALTNDEVGRVIESVTVAGASISDRVAPLVVTDGLDSVVAESLAVDADPDA